MSNAEYQRNYFKYNPKGAYIRQRANAKRRKIQWELTFEEWWDLWEKSGKWNERGTTRDSYCMSRIWDEGPYSPTNVKIVKMGANSRYAGLSKHHGWENGPIFKEI